MEAARGSGVDPDCSVKPAWAGHTQAEGHLLACVLPWLLVRLPTGYVVQALGGFWAQKPSEMTH